VFKSIKLAKSIHTVIDTDPIIIKLEVKADEFLDVEDVHEWRKVHFELSGGKPFCILLDATKGYFNMSPEGHLLLTSNSFAEHRIASALVVRSLANRLAGNFFIRMGGKRNVSRMFATEEEAIKWLKDLAKK
jgi:hypothetical protein